MDTSYRSRATNSSYRAPLRYVCQLTAKCGPGLIHTFLQRSNQSAEWQRGNHDTVYRFKRAQVQPRTKIILSPDQFHPPHHDQLSPEKGGQPGATQYRTNSLVNHWTLDDTFGRS